MSRNGQKYPADAPCRAARWGLIAFGGLNLGLGLIGVVVPVMPTTVFLLIALWAFSKSSLRFHRWLYEHPSLGRPLRDWHAQGAIPTGAKLLAVASMLASLAFVTLFVFDDWPGPAALALLFAALAAFILSRPSGRARLARGMGPAE